jgi:hypothetical protein
MISIVIGAAQVVATDPTHQLAFLLREPCGAHGAVEYGFLFIFPYVKR